MSGSQSSSSSPSWSGIFGQGILSKRIKSKRALFLVRLVFFFGLFYLLWYFLSPLYNQILAPLSEQIIKLTETKELPVTTSFEAVGKKILVYNVAFTDSPAFTIRGNVVHFDLVFVLALIWAVPNINLKRRGKIILWGLGILFGLHLIKMFVFVKESYCTHLSFDGVPYCTIFQTKIYQRANEFILLVVNQIFPVLIWGWLYWRYWWIRPTHPKWKGSQRIE